MAYEGLHKIWEDDPATRRRVLWTGYMLEWPSAKATGIASYTSAPANYDTLKPFFEMWTASCKKPKTPKLELLKAEAGYMHGNSIWVSLALTHAWFLEKLFCIPLQALLGDKPVGLGREEIIIWRN